MNKYFTKEYIKECDCKEIQKLRPKIENYEWVSEKKKIKATRVVASWEEDLDFFVNGDRRKEYIWLPTGDQLDEEIIKICKKGKYHYGYEFIWNKNNYKAWCVEDLYIMKVEINSNPPIAKIKLLKELIK